MKGSNEAGFSLITQLVVEFRFAARSPRYPRRS
jgi:hypothetical protein